VLTVPVVQSNDRGERSAQAARLTIQDAVDGRLRGLDLCRKASLAPAGLLLNFPEKGGRVFVHGS